MAELKALSWPELHPLIDDMIASGVLRAEFDRVVRDFGGSPRNYADRVGSGVLLLWSVYDRDSDDGESPTFTDAQLRGGARFLARLRSEMALRRPVRRLSDERMQRQSDTVGLIAVYVDVLVKAFARRGERAAAAQVQDAIDRRVEDAFGIHLSLLELDAKGFR